MFLGVMALSSALVPCSATPRVWTGGAGNSDWFADANWGGQHPLDGDTATISGATVILSGNSAALSSFTITNATLFFTNWATTLRATNVFIRNAGVLDLPAGFTTGGPSNRIHIVCSNFTLYAGGSINATAAGYLGANGLGAGAAGDRHRGGGYGGKGGIGYYTDMTGGYTYGNRATPLACGSGGGGDTVVGGTGGGAVLIEATGTATIDGTISANGGNGVQSTIRGGGGSGGAICVQCHTLAGSGRLAAIGGNGVALTGAGGGGRIAVDYTTAGASWPGLRFQTAPGTTPYAGRYKYNAEQGTVWLRDAGIFSTNMAPWLLGTNTVHFGSTSWSGSSFAVRSNSFRIGTTGFQFSVSGNVLIGSGGDCDFPNLRCGGSATLTNGGILRVHGDPTNAPMTYGGVLSVTNTLSIASNSTLWVQSDPTNGGSALIVAGSLVLARYGAISGYGCGYKPTLGPGAGSGNYLATQERGAGGGHGGKGGIGNYNPVSAEKSGRPSGSPDRPGPGSGGCSPDDGGWGGALIAVRANTATIHGTINANGSPNGNLHSGGGAGGGVAISCTTLAGSTNGLVQANGGTTASSVSGGGGGGRIAVMYQNASPWPGVRFSCSPGGTLYAGCTRTHLAEQGTVYLANTAALGSVMNGGRFTDVTLFISNTTEWAVGSLALSDCSFRMGDPAFHIKVTNDVLVGNNGIFGVANLDCGGNLIVRNGGKFDARAAATNTPGPVYGGLISITNMIDVGDASWIYASANETNGGAMLFRADSIAVNGTTNSGFDASGRGMRGLFGKGKGDPTERRRAGGYGGRAGYGAYGDSGGGLTYGSSNAPVLVGSGGGGDTTFPTVSPCASGYGGGLLRLEARGTITLNGSLIANGGRYAAGQTGGGSGGGIFVTCARFVGSGILQAKGGGGASASGGGGGGRVAVAIGLSGADRDMLISGGSVPRLVFTNALEDFTGAVQVSGGSGSGTNGPGKDGTTCYMVLPPLMGTMISIQ